jgi:hypothetical protein
VAVPLDEVADDLDEEQELLDSVDESDVAYELAKEAAAAALATLGGHSAAGGGDDADE